MAAKTNRMRMDDEATRELRRLRRERSDEAQGKKAAKPTFSAESGNEALEQASFLLMVIALAVFVAVGVYFLAS